MSKTTYKQAEQALKEAKCPKCQGSGEFDDAEPGDISYNTYHCNDCKRTGFKHGLQMTLVYTNG